MSSDSPEPVSGQPQNELPKPPTGEGSQDTGNQSVEGAGENGEYIFPDAGYINSTTGVGSYNPPSMQLVAPEKIVLDFPEKLNITQPNLTLKLSSENLPVRMTLNNPPLTVKVDESPWDRLLHSIPGIATALATLFTVGVLYKQNAIQKVQAEASKAQADAALRQADVSDRQNNDNLNNVRATIFREIVEFAGDEVKRNVAVMALAEHGERVLPVIGQALSFEEEGMRDNTAKVVYHLFHVEDFDPSKKGLRGKLYQNLLTYLESQEPVLLQGALTCFIQLEAQLTPEETSGVIERLERQFEPQTFCRDTNTGVMQKVAVLLGTRPTDRTRGFLLRIAATPSCGEARKQAVVSLASKWEENPSGRDDILAGLHRLSEEVRKESRSNKKAELQRTLQGLMTAIVTTTTVIERSRG